MADENLIFYTIEDLQNILHIGKNKAYELANQDDFPKIKIEKHIRIPKKEFEKWLNKNLYKTYHLRKNG